MNHQEKLVEVLKQIEDEFPIPNIYLAIQRNDGALCVKIFEIDKDVARYIMSENQQGIDGSKLISALRTLADNI